MRSSKVVTEVQEGRLSPEEAVRGLLPEAFFVPILATAVGALIASVIPLLSYASKRRLSNYIKSLDDRIRDYQGSPSPQASVPYIQVRIKVESGDVEGGSGDSDDAFVSIYEVGKGAVVTSQASKARILSLLRSSPSSGSREVTRAMRVLEKEGGTIEFSGKVEAIHFRDFLGGLVL